MQSVHPAAQGGRKMRACLLMVCKCRDKAIETTTTNMGGSQTQEGGWKLGSCKWALLARVDSEKYWFFI